MFTLEDYNIFRTKLQKIIDNTFESEPNENDLKQNFYFIKRGLWEGTEDQIFVYDKRKIPTHKKSLLTLCKGIPKFHKPSAEHGGTISSFDLLIDPQKHPNLTKKDFYYQIGMANHFTNLIEATGIAIIQPVYYENNKAFLIVLDPKYREYMEKDGIEPFDD